MTTVYKLRMLVSNIIRPMYIILLLLLCCTELHFCLFFLDCMTPKQTPLFQGTKFTESYFTPEDRQKAMKRAVLLSLGPTAIPRNLPYFSVMFFDVILSKRYPEYPVSLCSNKLLFVGWDFHLTLKDLLEKSQSAKKN